MESVVAQEPEAVLAGTQLLWIFYLKHNDAERAGHWQKKYFEQLAILQGAHQERSKLLISDAVTEHGLKPAEVSALAQQLRAIPDLARAYLVRKVTRYFPEKPLYVLGFTSGRWWQMHDSANTHALTQRISQEVTFPGETLIINLEGSNVRFAAKLRGVRDSRIL
jgi:hypothetical protein